MSNLIERFDRWGKQNLINRLIRFVCIFFVHFFIIMLLAFLFSLDGPEPNKSFMLDTYFNKMTYILIIGAFIYASLDFIKQSFL